MRSLSPKNSDIDDDKILQPHIFNSNGLLTSDVSVDRPEHDSNNGDENDNSNGSCDSPEGDASHLRALAVLVQHRPACTNHLTWM